MNGTRRRIQRGAGAAILAAGALVLLASLGGAGPAAAQQTPEQVRQYLERTDEILEQVTETVRDTESAQARRVLDEARSLQHRAKMMEADRPLLAMAASTRAREAAMDAARLARQALGAEERTRLRFERVQDYLDTLTDRAHEANNAEAQRFIDEAGRQLQRARDQYGQKNFEIAFNLVESSESLLNRAARLLFEQGGAPRLERDLEQTAEIVGRAREQARAADNRQALDMVERAQAALDQGRLALSHGEPLRALRQAGQARRLAARATALLERAPEPSAVRELIARWDARRGEIEGRSERAGDKRALALIDQAAGERRKAEELLESGHVEEALRHIKVAHDLLSQAAERAR